MLGRLAAELDRLRRNFEVILEMTGLGPGSPETAGMLHQAGELIEACGRRRGVWIISAWATTLLQFKGKLGGLFEPDATRTAGSVPEAEHVLETWDAPPGAPAAHRIAKREKRLRPGVGGLGFVDTLPGLPVHSAAR